jgi:hypothetical protein
MIVPPAPAAGAPPSYISSIKKQIDFLVNEVEIGTGGCGRRGRRAGVRWNLS